MGQKKLEDLHKDIAGMPAFFYMDLPGIRPISTNWPQQLVYSMMETLSSYRDRLTGLNKKFEEKSSSSLLNPIPDLQEESTDPACLNLENALFAYSTAENRATAEALIKAAKALDDEFVSALALSVEKNLDPSGNAAEKKAKAQNIVDGWDNWEDLRRNHLKELD